MLISNTSTAVALQTLTSVSKALADTNTQVSTGLRVNMAADGAAY